MNIDEFNRPGYIGQEREQQPEMPKPPSKFSLWLNERSLANVVGLNFTNKVTVALVAIGLLYAKHKRWI